MREEAAWLKLTCLTAAAGLLLGVTQAFTAPKIAQQALQKAEQARFAVFAQADAFEAVTLSEGAEVDACYQAMRSGERVGYVSASTVKGYGGPIEVTLGRTKDGVITGVQVGGANFSETAGLGAKIKDASFTNQFIGKRTPVALGVEIDGVSGATISSGAVVSAVNGIARFLDETETGSATPDPYESMLDTAHTALAHDKSVDAAYQTPDGFVVLVSQQGYHGAVRVAVALDPAGVVKRVAIDQNAFNETAGLGARVLEDWFLQQFIGQTGVIGVAVSGGDAASGATATAPPIEGAHTLIDGISGATISSNAIARAVNAAIAFVRAHIGA